MLNKVSKGLTFNYTVAGSPVVSGQLIVKGSLVGFAETAGAVGATIAVDMVGVFNYNKTASQVWAQGDKIYYDSSLDVLTNLNGQEESPAVNNAFVGFAFKAAAANDAKGEVLLVQVANPSAAQAENVAALGTQTVTDIAASYADLAAARTSVKALRDEVNTAIGNIRTTLNAEIAALKEAGIQASA